MNPYPTVLDLAKRVEALEHHTHLICTGDKDDEDAWHQTNEPMTTNGGDAAGIDPCPEPFLGAAHQSELELAHKPVDAGPAVDLNAMCEAASDEPYGKSIPQPQVDASAAIEGLRCVPWGVLAYSTAEAQLALIRAGKVPGVWYNQEIATEKNALRHEVSQLRAQLAEYEANAQLRDREEAACRAALKRAGVNAMLVESVPLSDSIQRLANELAEATAKLDYANRERDNLTRERNNFKGSNDTAIRQRDEARAEVERLKAKLDAHSRIINAAKDTAEALVMPRMESQDVCGLRELRNSLVAAGVEVT